MAPEVATMQDYGFGCDVYSFSITLWEICTLKRAFGDVSDNLVFDADVVRGNKRPSIKSISSSVIGALLKQGWDKDPSKRPSFGCVVKSLEDIVATTRAPVAKQGKQQSSPSQSKVTTSTFRNRLRSAFKRRSSTSDTQLNGKSNVSRLSTHDIQCNDESDGSSCHREGLSVRSCDSSKPDQSYNPSNESIQREMTQGSAVTRFMSPLLRRLSTTDISFYDESLGSNHEERSFRGLDSYKQKSFRISNDSQHGKSALEAEATSAIRVRRPFLRRFSTTDIQLNDDSARSSGKQESCNVRSLDSVKIKRGSIMLQGNQS
jgi:hypothetical protein